MKQGFKKLFKKKEKTEATEEAVSPQESYTATPSNSLYSMSQSDLVSIIFKFDQEVKNLNKELSSSKDQVLSFKAEYPKAQEQLSLYKQHNETLQSECNRLAIDLNEVNTSLDSRIAQIDLLKSQLNSQEELSNSFKIRIQELEKQVIDLQMAGISMNNSETMDLLKAQFQDSSKNSAEINELKIKNKVLEGEILKLNGNAKDYHEQIRISRDKVSLFENSKKEMEIEVSRAKAEIERLGNEISKLHFLKESNETEIRALKETCVQKEKRLSKKVLKIENLTEQNNDFIQKNSILKYELDNLKLKSENDLALLCQKHTEDLDLLRSTLTQKIFSLSSEIESLTKFKNDFESLEPELKKSQLTISQQQESMVSTFSELHQKTIKLNSIEQDNLKLAEQLEKSNSKRELARKEIIRLTQKLEILQSSKEALKTESKPLNFSVTELGILNSYRNELEVLYKSLMKMISGNDAKNYLVGIEDFSNFEKKMNNLLMQIHERLEDANEQKAWRETQKGNEVKGVKGRTPIKLFSCMADQDDAPARLIPKPKKPPIQNDDRLVFRRGSAN